MESSDLFSSLLQNPETMRQLASLASEVMGGMASQSPPSDGSAPAPQTLPAAPQQAPDPTSDLMRKAMPALSAIAQSAHGTADPARVQLLHALKPFVSPKTCEQIDHAERILSMARLAKAAAGQFLPHASGTGQEG